MIEIPRTQSRPNRSSSGPPFHPLRRRSSGNHRLPSWRWRMPSEAPWHDLRPTSGSGDLSRSTTSRRFTLDVMDSAHRGRSGGGGGGRGARLCGEARGIPPRRESGNTGSSTLSGGSCTSSAARATSGPRPSSRRERSIGPRSCRRSAWRSSWAWSGFDPQLIQYAAAIEAVIREPRSCTSRLAMPGRLR